MIDTSDESLNPMTSPCNAMNEILDSGLQPTDKIRRLAMLINTDEYSAAAAAVKIVMDHERNRA